MGLFTSTDIAGKWFRAAEAAGDDMGIRSGKKPLSSEEVEWSFISHIDCDGIGGFTRFLREHGAEVMALPQTNYSNRQILKPLWNFMRQNSNEAKLALKNDWMSPTTEVDTSREAVACHLFTEEETKALRNACRAQKVTVNSKLLKSLDSSIRSDVKKPSSSLSWLVPVNLRGDIKSKDPTANHASCIRVIVASEDSVNVIQNQISERLECGEHRAGFLILLLGIFLTHHRKVSILRKRDDKPAGNIGAFSNLGVWDSEKEINFSDACFFCPPVCRGYLLSAGCVTFQNRLSLTIQAPSGGVESFNRVSKWMQSWVDEMIQMLD